MAAPSRWIPIVVLVVLLAASAPGTLRYIPFDGPSYAAWAGIFVALAGLFSLAWPLRFLCVRSRGRGLQLLVAGALLTAGALLWPVSVRSSSAPHKRLDDFLPRYQFTERHEARVRAPRAAVLEAIAAVSFADMPVTVMLMRARALADGSFSSAPPDTRPILDLMTRPGSSFLALDRSDPAEQVLGMVGRPWANGPRPSVTNAAEFAAFAAPGQIRVAFDLRASDGGAGTVLVSTETRTLGNDEAARRTFGRYWRIIYPGSAIIRRVWLDAIVARAERRSGTR
jgi:hypothetical protein